jgi:uncharacterized protein (TIGR02246 family)
MHPACLWTTHTGLVLGRDEYVARNTTLVTWQAQHVDLDHVRVHDDVAVALGVASDTVLDGGHPVHTRMRVTFVWVRDGRWRLLTAHAGPRIGPAE